MAQGEANPWQFIDKAGLELYRYGDQDHRRDDDHALLLPVLVTPGKNMYGNFHIIPRRGATRGQATTVCR